MSRSRKVSTVVRVVLFVAIVAALVPLFTQPAHAQGLTKVSVRVNGFPYGSHAGFFAAKKLGLYEKLGLDVEILSASGSGNVAQLVANKSADFGYASSARIITNVANDAPIISVAVIDATDADAVICRPDANIKEPKDLEGKVVLTASGAGVNVLFPAFLKAAGVDASKVKLTNVAAEAVVPGLLEKVGGAVCLLGGLDDKPAQIKQEGKFDPTFIAYNQYIPVTVGYGIITHTDNLKSRPDVVRAFVEASLQGYAFAMANPQAALDAFMFYNGAQVREQMEPQLMFTLKILTSKNNTQGQIGLHVEKDWQATLDVQKQYNDLKTDKPLSAFYTNDFLPKTLAVPTMAATQAK